MNPSEASFARTTTTGETTTTEPPPSDVPSAPDASSRVYYEFIQQLVESQEARKESIEKRGLSVITTSGTLTTVLFGLVAVFTGIDDFLLPKTAKGPLGVAVALLAAGAVLGLATNVPLWFYGNVKAKDMHDRVKTRFVEPETTAHVRLSATNVEIFRRAKRANGIKAWVLVGAMVAEVAGVVSVAIAVAEIIQHS